MPRFELAVIYRILRREKKIEVVKNCVKYMIQKGYNVRKLHSLGDRGLPIKLGNPNVETLVNGSYILYDIDVKTSDFSDIELFFQSHPDVLHMMHLPHGSVYHSEPACNGIELVNYAAKVEELKNKTQTISKPFYNR